MSGCQKTTILILCCAAVIALITLFALVQNALWPSRLVVPSPCATPNATSTATETASASATATRAVSKTPGSATPTLGPTNTPLNTPTVTATQPSSPTSTATARPTVPAEVTDYLEEFVGLVGQVHDMKLLAGTTQIEQSTVDAVRRVYRRLHEMEVPEGAEEMHLAFIIYASMLEEKCLCHIFAQIHSSDAQGQHYRECENRATNVAMDIMSNRFIPSRESFLQEYGLHALEVGFPY